MEEEGDDDDDADWQHGRTSSTSSMLPICSIIGALYQKL